MVKSKINNQDSMTMDDSRKSVFDRLYQDSRKKNNVKQQSKIINFLHPNIDQTKRKYNSSILGLN
jgi:hypothetical protein